MRALIILGAFGLLTLFTAILTVFSYLFLNPILGNLFGVSREFTFTLSFVIAGMFLLGLGLGALKLGDIYQARRSAKRSEK